MDVREQLAGGGRLVSEGWPEAVGVEAEDEEFGGVGVEAVGGAGRLIRVGAVDEPFGGEGVGAVGAACAWSQAARVVRW